jgi:hypothetical protein
MSCSRLYSIHWGVPLQPPHHHYVAPYDGILCTRVGHGLGLYVALLQVHYGGVLCGEVGYTGNPNLGLSLACGGLFLFGKKFFYVCTRNERRVKTLTALELVRFGVHMGSVGGLECCFWAALRLLLTVCTRS